MSTALLVIDVQESFRARDSWSTVSAPDIADRIQPLVEEARTAGHHVVWSCTSNPVLATSSTRPWVTCGSSRA